MRTDGGNSTLQYISDKIPQAVKKHRKKLYHIIALGFFVYIFFLAMAFSLNDPDIWWHLKTGEYIVENWEVPDVDPFAYTTPRPLSGGQKIGLKAHWLGQVIFYISYLMGGLMGVGIFRSLLIVLPMALLYIWLSRRGVPVWASLVVCSFPSLLLVVQLFYSFERPQGISFSLVLIVLMLLEGIKRRLAGMDPQAGVPGVWQSVKKLRFFIVLPAIMLVWSNIHGGFIVGNVMVILYVAGEAAVWLYRMIRRSGNVWEFPVLAAFGAVSIVATFVNPNTYRLFKGYTLGLVKMFYGDIARTVTGSSGAGWVENVVLEYKSLMYFYKFLFYDWLVFFWIFAAVLYVLLAIKYWLRRKIDVTEFVIVSFFFFFANYYARGLMFGLVVLPFYAGKTLLELNVPGRAYKVVFKTAVAVMLTITIGFVTFTNKAAPYALKPGITRVWITPWYPRHAVNFIKQNKIQGPMYNFYTWGGFLIWSMYPEYKVFIDGRALEDNVNRTADAILKTYTGWRRNLEAYNINFIFIPVVFRESGHIIPLATALVDDDRWKLIYIRQNSAVFVRNTPRNQSLIYKFNHNKKSIYREIIRVENILLAGSRGNPTYNMGKGDALFSLGMYAEAKSIYLRFPQQAAHRLEKLKSLGY